MVKMVHQIATRKIPWGSHRTITVPKIAFHAPLAQQVAQRSQCVYEQTDWDESHDEHLVNLNDSVMAGMYGDLKSSNRQALAKELIRVYSCLRTMNQRILYVESQNTSFLKILTKLFTRIEFVFAYAMIKLAPTPPPTPPPEDWDEMAA